MIKKRSFFERLTNSLRFDDTEQEQLVAEKQLPQKNPEIVPERKLFVGNENTRPEPQEVPQEKEVVGELPVDVYETPNEIIIQTLIGGVLPENLSIGITRDVVSIEGKRESNKSIQENQYHYKELFWGSFKRVITLPEEVEIDTAEAIERHGMLLIKLPKIDKARKAMLKIKSI